MKENMEKQPDKTQALLHTQNINKPLKLNTVNKGEPTDNVLVHGANNEIKSIPWREFGISSIEIKGEYSNNQEALQNGLVDGDIYSLPLDTNGNNTAFLAVVKNASLAILTLTWANIDADLSSFRINDKYSLSQWEDHFLSRLDSSTISSLKITGNTIIFKFQNPTLISNVDLSNMRLIDVELENFNQMTYLGLDNNNLTHFDPNIPLPESLNRIGLSGNQLTDFNPTLPLPYNLNTLEIRFNQLTNFSPKLPSGFMTLWLDSNNLETLGIIDSLPSNLRFLELAYNKLSDFNPSIPLPQYMTNLGLMGNNLTDFNPTLPLPNSLNYLNLNGNKLTKFNPSLPLPDSLRQIYITSNLINNSSWNNETQWISTAPDKGVISSMSNTNTIIGTTTETLLLAKDWKIQIF
ncbi:hypothetical protein CLU81_1167 [Flavobacterium sp. 9]|uniref:hypothetical protein n=1 Tax=Flavobacterium sp. 9 TaxID=2035198 RepID=UPI000C17F5D8|nr:hypothetical protein [Flavobacterium sp. 9]PIF30720.1 hypothetical protein CLU81_1167 [Flavobacterium sp. 9]